MKAKGDESKPDIIINQDIIINSNFVTYLNAREAIDVG